MNPAAKKELRQMLQQELDYASISANAHSDDDTPIRGYPRREKRHHRDRNEIRLSDIKQFQSVYQRGDQYKKSKHAKSQIYNQDVELNRTKSKQRSKSPSRFSSSSPIPPHLSKASSFGGGRSGS